MPNQNFCGPHDDMNVMPCDFTKSYKSCQPSEKFCRFAYANWCPVCDLESHSRRSKSECIDSHFRKRGRDMKSPSPKQKDTYTENQDYLELRDIRLDSSRIRNNLCELPTTYINNCQTNVPSSAKEMTYTGKLSNFVEPLYDDRFRIAYANEICHQKSVSSVRNGDTVIINGVAKYNVPCKLDHVECESNFDYKNSCSKHNGFDNAEQVVCEIPRSERDHIKNKLANAYRNQATSVKSSPIKSSPNITNGYRDISPKHLNGIKQFASNENHVKTGVVRRQLPVLDPTKQQNNLDKYKNVEQNEAKHKHTNLKCQSTVEQNETSCEQIEVLDVKVKGNVPIDLKRYRVRQRNDSDNVNVTPETPTESCSVLTKKAREISPIEKKRELRSKSTVKIASIKTRHKLSAIKLRKVRSKIAHSVSSDSNFSDSDYSEPEEKSEVSESLTDGFSVESVTCENGSTPINAAVPVVIPDKELEQAKWPIRPSLFPYIPPYISFSSHDSEVFKLPPGVARFLKWKLSTITPVVVRKTLLNTGFRLVRSECPRESNDWIGTWGKHIKSTCFQSLKDTQKLNHFPGTFQIGRKDRLWKNLQRLMFKYGHKEFGFIPRTFILPQDLKLLRQAWEKTGHEKWIIKPPASARGTGIKVIHRWTHLPKKKSLVVQQYISNPYLINGSKFDLRLYVLVTSFNPLRIYLYPDGLARFASTKYSDDLNTLSDRYMHLTNYSINKLSSQYTTNEDANACKGHKWTLSKLWEYLEKDGVNTKILWRALQQLVIKTILCGESSIAQLYKANVNSRYNCYELFGIDVLLDERLKPWLLEVNISPSLHSASPLDLHVKGPLVQALLNLAQFHLPPKLGRIRVSPPCLNGDLYTTQLTVKERHKHNHFAEFETREEYLNDILDDLTGDDVRHLTQAEDELTVADNFERIFPTQHTHYYLQFMETRYYNRLFDAWETRYENKRTGGIKLLQSLCEKKLHFDIAASPIAKSLPSETERESSPEISVSDDLVVSTTPKRPQTCPAAIISEPVTNALVHGIRNRMVKLNLASSKTKTPF